MKRLALLLCLLPSIAMAQESHSTSTSRSSTAAPTTPLIRTAVGQDCQGLIGGNNSPGLAGTVRLSYVVGSDGEVSTVTITGSSDSTVLDRNATDCVKSWKFVTPERYGLKSVSGLATVTYTVNVQGRKRFTTASWNTPGMRIASDIAVNSIVQQVIDCMRGKPGMMERTAGKAPTLYRLTYFRGEISKVEIANASGDDALDKEGFACFTAVPRNEARAQILDRVGTSTVTLPWATLFQTAATH